MQAEKVYRNQIKQKVQPSTGTPPRGTKRRMMMMMMMTMMG